MSNKGTIYYCGTPKNFTKFDPLAILGDTTRMGTHVTVATYKDGTFKGYGHYGCMAKINSFGLDPYVWPPKDMPPITSIYSTLWMREGCRQEDYLPFWDFMLDQDKSPWRMVLKDVEIIKDKKGNYIGYCLNDMSQPFQVIANLMFAIRMGYSQDGYITSFNKLRAEEFSDVDAMYLTANFATIANGMTAFPYLGDYPFDTCWDDMDYKAFNNGKPKNLTANTVQSGVYTPCNVIWSKTKAVAGNNYNAAQRKRTKVQELISTEEVAKSFGKIKFFPDTSTPMTVVKHMPFDDAVKALKDTDTWKA